MITFPVTQHQHHHPLATTKLYCLTKTHVLATCPKSLYENDLAQSWTPTFQRPTAITPQCNYNKIHIIIIIITWFI